MRNRLGQAAWGAMGGILALWLLATTWPGTPRTWVQDELVTPTMMNTEVRDRAAYFKEQLGSISGLVRGLRLTSDPNSGTSKVLLRVADQIVMDTGRGISTWSNLTADIAASGACGLDTGSEAASTWYEIWAIVKSSDDTKCIILHRAKDYFKDEDHDADDTTSPIRRSTGTRTAYGQGFKVDTTGLLEFVDAEIIRVGAVSGLIWAELYSDNAGVPSSTLLASSDKIDAAVISTTSHFIRFEFRSTPATLTATTQYHLVLTGDWTASDAVYIGWRTDTSSPGYSNGVGTVKEAGVWAADATPSDASFKAYITRNDTSVTMPSGYDEKALIGYVYNNASSDLMQFDARERMVLQLSSRPIYSASSISNLTIQDLSTLLPPRPTVLYPVVDTGSATSMTFAPMPGIIAVAVDNTSLPRVAGSTKITAATGTIVELGPLSVSAYQYAYAINNGSSSSYVGTWGW